jgi:hypothetical protein
VICATSTSRERIIKRSANLTAAPIARRSAHFD